jgi:hypothetical protein
MTGSDWVEGGLTPDDAVTFAIKASKQGRARLRVRILGGYHRDTRPTMVANMNVSSQRR